MAKVLVTGGAGFIGSHVSKLLLEAGDDVVIVDSFNDYYNPQLKKDRIKNILGEYKEPRLKVYEQDIADLDEMDKIFKEHNFDKVCNLAAQAGVRYALEKPFTYVHSNVTGFVVILELCRKYEVNNLVYASTSSIYGDNEKMPFSEEDRTDHQVSLYAATKKANEVMAYTYHKSFGLNATGVRFFTVYGPWGRPDMGVTKFIKWIANEDPVKIFNNGDMSRDFTYVDDIAQGVFKALEKCYPYEIFNLARGENIKLMDYINLVSKNVGKPVIKEMMPMQLGDVKETSADISKAKEMLGYAPTTSVDLGVKNAVEWYMNYHNL